MLLSYLELMELVEQGVINAHPDQVNGASIDVTLDDTLLIEKRQVLEPLVCLVNKSFPDMIEFKMVKDRGFRLLPGQFVLANTREIFNLTNDIACEFKLKSSVARSGLNNMLATWCDPGWSNSRLTLELKNDLQYHCLQLMPGMKIGQMVFYRTNPVPHEHSYLIKGRYNNTTTVTATKGV